MMKAELEDQRADKVPNVYNHGAGASEFHPIDQARKMIRVLLSCGLFAGSVFCVSGGIANGWAAWAPPGEANPRYGMLRFNEYLFFGLAMICFVGALLVLFVNRPSALIHWGKEDTAATPHHDKNDRNPYRSW